MLVFGNLFYTILVWSLPKVVRVSSKPCQEILDKGGGGYQWQSSNNYDRKKFYGTSPHGLQIYILTEGLWKSFETFQLKSN